MERSLCSIITHVVTWLDILHQSGAAGCDGYFVFLDFSQGIKNSLILNMWHVSAVRFLCSSALCDLFYLCIISPLTLVILSVHVCLCA